MEINNERIKSDLNKLEYIINMQHLESDNNGDVFNSLTDMNEFIIKSIINKYRHYEIRDISLRNKYNNLLSKYFARKSKKSMGRRTESSLEYIKNKDENVFKIISGKIDSLGLTLPSKIEDIICNKVIDLMDKGYKLEDINIKYENDKIRVVLS
ncbi:MAG: hypothetical protein SVN78_10205 [Deferribacterota bacterium]|nr:hypothetical protein [Deferribacterota bacterium]